MHNVICSIRRCICILCVYVLVYLYTHFMVKIKSSALFCSVLSPYPLPRSHPPLLPCNWSWSCFSIRPMKFSQFVDRPIPLVRTCISTVSVSDDSDSPLFHRFFSTIIYSVILTSLPTHRSTSCFYSTKNLYNKGETWNVVSMDYILPPSDQHSAMWIGSGGHEEQQWVVKCRFLRGVPWGVLLTADINSM